jgi:alanine racemase
LPFVAGDRYRAMVTSAHSPLRLSLDGEALISNWHWLQARSGSAACGAAVKADGYGIGATEVVARLRTAGCRDFFVSTWAEAEAVLPAIGEASLSVLHGLAGEDMDCASTSLARPVLNTPAQVMRWREAGQGRPCDVMIDTGMNRLGLSGADIAGGLLNGMSVDVLMSHLACADDDVATNARQRDNFREIAAGVPAKRLSLANSAGICLGAGFAFDLTRPGLALYGGLPRGEARGNIVQVAHVEAQIIQRRRIARGDRVGYNETFQAGTEMELAILNIGYADGYLRGFSGTGIAKLEGRRLPVVGRISMDLTAIDVGAAPELKEGDWVELDYDLAAAAAQSGLSQYELLTTLGHRFRRSWR